MAAAAAPSPSGETLTDLVQSALAAGLTHQELADRSRDPETGQTVSRSWVNNLARGQVDRMPELPTIRALAAGLNKPLNLVTEAAARQWLNYEASTLTELGDDVRIIVAHLATMSEADRRRWRRQIEAWSDTRDD
jgi:hypothetical protein